MQSFDYMLLDWARKQPADAEYDYGSNGDCALCQFLRDTGICSDPSVGGTYWRSEAAPWGREFEHGLSKAVASALIADTFGELSDRLSERLAAQVPA